MPNLVTLVTSKNQSYRDSTMNSWSRRGLILPCPFTVIYFDHKDLTIKLNIFGHPTGGRRPVSLISWMTNLFFIIFSVKKWSYQKVDQKSFLCQKVFGTFIFILRQSLFCPTFALYYTAKHLLLGQWLWLSWQSGCFR